MKNKMILKKDIEDFFYQDKKFLFLLTQKEPLKYDFLNQIEVYYLRNNFGFHQIIPYKKITQSILTELKLTYFTLATKIFKKDLSNKITACEEEYQHKITQHIQNDYENNSYNSFAFSDKNKIHLGLNQIFKSDNLEIKNYSCHEMFSNTYFHEVGHFFEFNDEDIFFEENIDQTTKEYNFILNFIDNYLFDENEETNLSKDLEQILFSFDNIFSIIKETYADTFALLLLSKRNPDSFDKYFNTIQAQRLSELNKNNKDYLFEHSSHFTILGLSEVPEIIQKLNIDLKNIEIEQIIQVCRESTKKSTFKFFYSLLEDLSRNTDISNYLNSRLNKFKDNEIETIEAVLKSNNIFELKDNLAFTCHPKWIKNKNYNYHIEEETLSHIDNFLTKSNNKNKNKIILDKTIKKMNKFTPLNFVIAENKEHLQELIKKEIELNGNECDLNYIDVSKIKDISSLFEKSNFNGDISKWDVSNIENMEFLFSQSNFNGDISKWNTKNVRSMLCTFSHSQFNKDISEWNVSNVKNMKYIFSDSQFNQDISKWNVSNVEDMRFMFSHSQFNRDISNWNVSNVIDMSLVFSHSKFNKDISEWDVSNVINMNSTFKDSAFNGDISKWNISKVENMTGCFTNAQISPWWNIKDYEERQIAIQKRELEGFFVSSSKAKKIKV